MYLLPCADHHVVMDFTTDCEYKNVIHASSIEWSKRTIYEHIKGPMNTLRKSIPHKNWTTLLAKDASEVP